MDEFTSALYVRLMCGTPEQGRDVVWKVEWRNIYSDGIIVSHYYASLVFSYYMSLVR